MTDEDGTPSDPDGARAPAGDDPAQARTATRLLELLVCPVTKSTLELSSDGTELISRRARLAFPIHDGIPLLTRDSARELTDDDH